MRTRIKTMRTRIKTMRTRIKTMRMRIKTMRMRIKTMRMQQMHSVTPLCFLRHRSIKLALIFNKNLIEN
jgi:hypothetical protein